MYCMACGKEYENEMFCPECGRMLVSAHTFDYQKKESYKNYMEEELKAEKERIKQKEEQEAKLKQQEQYGQNIPKCPTCGSTNVRPISGFNRAGSMFMWGIMSSKIGKTYECLNCKYKW